jgi:hypothetical protein
METNCICQVFNEMSTIVDICVFELLYPHTKRIDFQCLFTLEKMPGNVTLKCCIHMFGCQVFSPRAIARMHPTLRWYFVFIIFQM